MAEDIKYADAVSESKTIETKLDLLFKDIEDPAGGEDYTRTTIYKDGDEARTFVKTSMDRLGVLEPVIQKEEEDRDNRSEYTDWKSRNKEAVNALEDAKDTNEKTAEQPAAWSSIFFDQLQKDNTTVKEAHDAGLIYKANRSFATGNALWKTLFQESYGAAATQSFSVERLRDYRTDIQDRVALELEPDLASIIPMIQTALGQVSYLKQTITTKAVDSRAEGGEAAEADISYADVQVTLENVSAQLPITEQMLEDRPSIEAMLDLDLRDIFRETINNATLKGLNTPIITGVNEISGIGTQAVLHNADPDVKSYNIMAGVRKQITSIRSDGKTRPTHAILTPELYEMVRLGRDLAGGAGTGQFLMGPPNLAGPPMLWGVAVIESDAQTANRITTGNFSRFARYFTRGGLTIELGYSEDDWVKFKRTLRANLRMAFVYTRATAFNLATVATT